MTTKIWWTPEWVSGYITIDGAVTVLAEYDNKVRWNGFLCPWIDALSCVEVVSTLNALNAAVGEAEMVLDWNADGALVLTDLLDADDPDYEPEVIPANADGLYSLGAYAWTWSPDQWCNHDAVAVVGGVCECGARVLA